MEKRTTLKPTEKAYLEAKGFPVTLDSAGQEVIIAPCSRCWGSGQYSRCEMWGTTCFECGTRPGVPGSGKQVHQALKYYRRLKRHEAEDRRNQARTAAHEAELEAQRERNGGLTDEEVRQEVAAEVQAFDEYETWARKQTLRHLGTVGEMLEVEVDIVLCLEVETQFGPSFLVKMVDAAGNQLVAFSKSTFDLGKARVRGKVKEHGEYKETPQTKLTHLKTVGEEVRS